MRYRLIRPLDYLRIKHEQKTKYDIYIPATLTILSIFIYILLPVKPNTFGSGSITNIIGGLLQLLSGFYIASLAAIATFNKQGMDSVMPGVAPTLETLHRGSLENIKLTRRRFLCLMFGFLAFSSIALYLFGGLAEILSSNYGLLSGQVKIYIKYIFLSVYFFVFYNIMTTTCLGLYYMSDRIHRGDPEHIGKPGNGKPE